MALQIACDCGKRYRVPESSRGKRLRCKECGAELVVPRENADDEFDLAVLNAEEAFESEIRQLVPRDTRGRKDQAESDGAERPPLRTSDLVIRITGVGIFFGTLANCLVLYLMTKEKPDAVAPQGPTIDFFIWGLLPIPIVGLLGLYVAWVGEEPDPELRRYHRSRGLAKCGIGVGLIIAGCIFTLLATLVVAKLGFGAILFTGLIIAGFALIFFGGLSALTGREFKNSRGF